MSFFISTNTSALRAGASLALNICAQNNSMDRLSSGKRLRDSSEDAGALAVSTRLNSTINRMDGTVANIQNAVSYLEVQDGVLQTAGSIIERIIELKSLASRDPMKSGQDRASYNSEFEDLQEQLYQISQTEFNGVSLFARYNEESPFFKEVWFMSDHEDWVYGEPNSSWAHTQTIHTSASGSNGPRVSIYKLPLLSALTIDNHYFEEAFNTSTPVLGSVPYGVGNSGNADANGDDSTSFIVRLAVDPNHKHPFFRDLLDLADVSVAVFVKALDNISFLRAQNGGVHSRLAFSTQSLIHQKVEMRAALGRMVDVDVALETTSLARHTMLTQASASMLAQSNQNTDIALLLLR